MSSVISCLNSFCLSLLTLGALTIGLIQTGHYLLGRFFEIEWVMPILMVIAVFMGGALIRKWISRHEYRHTGLFHLIAGILALCVFSLMTWWDIHQSTMNSFTFYSRLLPVFWDPGLTVWAYALPAVGLLGLITAPIFLF